MYGSSLWAFRCTNAAGDSPGVGCASPRPDVRGSSYPYMCWSPLIAAPAQRSASASGRACNVGCREQRRPACGVRRAAAEGGWSRRQPVVDGGGRGDDEEEKELLSACRRLDGTHSGRNPSCRDTGSYLGPLDEVALRLLQVHSRTRAATASSAGGCRKDGTAARRLQGNDHAYLIQ